jgi:hypothetical protein
MRTFPVLASAALLSLVLPEGSGERTWGPLETCPEGYFVKGIEGQFKRLNEGLLVTGVELTCALPGRFASLQSNRISSSSKIGFSGGQKRCSGSNVVNQIRFYYKPMDKSAKKINNVAIHCSNGDEKFATGTVEDAHRDADFIFRSHCSPNAAICGIRTQLDSNTRKLEYHILF